MSRFLEVYFDTNVFMHMLNATPGFAAPSAMLLEACAARLIVGLTGDVTLAELMVKPLGDQQLLTAPTSAASTTAPSPWSDTTAPRSRCLISNDRQFPPLPDIECLSLAG